MGSILHNILSKRTFILIVCSVIAVLCTSTFWLYAQSKNSKAIVLSNPDASVHTVTLTETGFEPEELVIRNGEKVIFKTDRTTPFWPASSLHPTHELYPRFDAKQPIDASSTWEFIFDQPGSWRYHDHISDHQSGVIHVLTQEEESKGRSPTKKEDCTQLSGHQKTICWDEQLRNVVLTEGADAGFDYLIEIYNAEPDVTSTCHEWVHVLGEAGYEIFASGNDPQLRSEMSWCSYGYFHGFMNAMIEDTGVLDNVVTFCNFAVAQLEDDMPIIESNCLHGIGHVGVDLLFENPEYWGDYMKTADSAFALCDDLFGDNRYINECYAGVIHGLRFSMRNQINGMDFADHLTNKDPYFYCRPLELKHQPACYSDFASMFWEVFEGDIGDAVQYMVEKTPTETMLKRSLTTVATGWVEHDLPQNDHTATIAACRPLSEDLLTACLQGIIIGFIHHGEPNNIHPKAFAFCRSDELHKDEQKLCFTYITQFLNSAYDEDRMNSACSTLADSEKYGRCAS